MDWVELIVERPDVNLWGGSCGEGDPVVVLHGLAGHSGEWAATASRLSDAFKIVSFDARGHGRSTRRPRDLSRRAYVEDTVAVITAVSPGRPVTLVGQSMGAHTAMLTAAAYPELVERLVMVEGGVGGGRQQDLERVREWLAGWPVPFLDADAALAYFGAAGPQPGMGAGAAARAWAAGLEAGADGLWPRFDPQVLLESISYVLAEPAWAAWRSLRQPTLLVLGKHGTIGADQVSEMLVHRPDTRLAVVSHAGHDVHLDQPDALAAAVREFLAASN